ncbi:MAG: MarR family transcriptional regulator [Pseudomonadota bacterium]
MHHKKNDDLDSQMRVVRDFIDALYNKTLFKNGKEAGTELPPWVIKSLFAFIVDTGEYPMGELGRNAQVKTSTITNMVDRLEKTGIAERVRYPGDRRVVKVRLTKKGKSIKKEFSQKRRTEFQGILTKLGEKETRQLIYHLDKAYQLLKKIK